MKKLSLKSLFQFGKSSSRAPVTMPSARLSMRKLGAEQPRSRPTNLATGLPSESRTKRAPSCEVEGPKTPVSKPSAKSLQTPPWKKRRAILTIGRKLIGLNTILLIATITSLMWVVTGELTQDNISLIQQNNAEAAIGLATQTRNVLESALEKTSVLGRTILLQDNADESFIQESFFNYDKDYLGILVFKRNSEGKYELARSAFSTDFASTKDAQLESLLDLISKTPTLNLEAVARGNSVTVESLSFAEKGPVLALATAVGAQDELGSSEYVFMGLLGQGRVISNFSNYESLNAFLVDGKGNLLAHGEAARVTARENVAHLEIVKKLLEGKSTNQTMQFIDAKTGEGKLGAFQTLGFSGLSVVIEVPEAKAFEVAHQIRGKAVWISLVILSLSFLFAYLYSETISRPIQRLSEAALRIAGGDFEIFLKSRGNDEVAQLSQTFNQMAVDLKQRIYLIETFNKYHNKEIAERIMAGDIAVGGETKNAVVFFSDIRGFTSMSETMSASEVVSMLNEYMSVMVAVIRNHKGVVDKFVGDAIMALWGVPTEGPDDVINALNACMDMRLALQKFNEERVARGKVQIQIGMGLNYGEVVAGEIGSDEKLEYTVIGDTVNVASRIESLTKSMQSDLLVSASVMERAGSHFIFEECESVHVKGKSAALKVYKVLGPAKSSVDELTEKPAA